MKVLYVTTIGATMGFFKSFIKELIQTGNTVDIATNDNYSKVPQCYYEWGCRVFHLSCERFVFAKGNYSAIKQIKNIVSSEEYDIVHCHTPIAAACTRIACRELRKNGLKVVYTAHGFHFCKGAPIKNWILYYPVERICSKFTDVLITINNEDYLLSKRKMKAKYIEYVPGVGVDLNRFAINNDVNDRILKELHIDDNKTILLSVGELSSRKNHEIVIKAIADLDETIRSKVVYLIAGEGQLKNYLLQLIDKLNLNDCIRLLGFRTDTEELYKESQIFVFPSKREGLPVALMEAMASGRYCIVSDIRGNSDLIEDGKGGHIIQGNDHKEWANCLRKVLVNEECYQNAACNIERMKEFSEEVVNEKMMSIYNSLMGYEK